MPTELEIQGRIVEASRLKLDHLITRQLVVFGLLHFNKWDRSLTAEKNGESITPDTLDRIANRFSDRDIAQFETNANQSLERFGIDYATSNPIKPSWLTNAWHSCVGAAMYSGILIFFYFVLMILGIDILGVVREVHTNLSQ